jgi:putative molybdopterin biosynthesis protein
MSTVETRLLTPSEVAVELRISAPTVYRLIDRGELPAAKIGGQLRIERADLEALLTRRAR